jgi:hypothetical protein
LHIFFPLEQPLDSATAFPNDPIWISRVLRLVGISLRNLLTNSFQVANFYLTIWPAGGIVTPIMNPSICAAFGSGTMTTMTTQDSPLGVGASPAD